ncbi:hypothetical protein LCGC14_2730220 [marine sediment metagenome]|uniref:Uncharacterized protein n=1 Tax=marine sediment metagenome TaxID=412755 RepID=A0A0F9BZ62_9ZZZZ
MADFVQQKPIDEADDCAQWPSCFLTFQDLNRMRTTTYYVMKAWVPGWLWAITPHFAKPWLTREEHGDLTPEGILRGAERYRRMELAFDTSDDEEEN